MIISKSGVSIVFIINKESSAATAVESKTPTEMGFDWWRVVIIERLQ